MKTKKGRSDKESLLGRFKGLMPPCNVTPQSNVHLCTGRGENFCFLSSRLLLEEHEFSERS